MLISNSVSDMSIVSFIKHHSVTVVAINGSNRLGLASPVLAMQRHQQSKQPDVGHAKSTRHISQRLV